MYDKSLFCEYPLKGIERKLWDRVRAAAKAKGINLRMFVLQAIKEKLERDANEK